MKRSRACEDLVALEHSRSTSTAALSPWRRMGGVKRNKLHDRADDVDSGLGAVAMGLGHAMAQDADLDDDELAVLLDLPVARPLLSPTTLCGPAISVLSPTPARAMPTTPEAALAECLRLDQHHFDSRASRLLARDLRADHDALAFKHKLDDPALFGQSPDSPEGLVRACYGRSPAFDMTAFIHVLDP